ncbi:unnamed protein product [Dicrocoelium dendriticum]|nr:unnamed protein product [Dicrocoelium dendriticum]
MCSTLDIPHFTGLSCAEATLLHIIIPYQMFNINCLPTNIRNIWAIPNVTIGLVTLILISAYLYLFGTEYWTEVLGVVMNTLHSLILGGILIHNGHIGKQMSIVVTSLVVCNTVQGFTLFVHSCLLKEKGLKMLPSLHALRRRLQRPKESGPLGITQQSHVDIRNLNQQPLPSFSGSTLFPRESHSIESLSSLELEGPDERLPVKNRKGTRTRENVKRLPKH